MSTNDVPGSVLANRDVLAMGCWAEHDDGSLVFVESVEGGRVVFSVFDMAVEPKVEYRTALPEDGFKERFSWDPHRDDDDDNIRWTWHDKTRFPWETVMASFPAGEKYVSAHDQETAAQRVARSLDLRAGPVQQLAERRPSMQRAARTIMDGVREAVRSLRP